MTSTRRAFRAYLKFWNGCELSGESLDEVELATAFDLGIDVAGVRTLSEAGGECLHRASRLDRPPFERVISSPLSPTATQPDKASALVADLDPDNLPSGSPFSLWRARDGWVIIFTAEPYAWRTFCATFLNRSVAMTVPAASAWSNPLVNALATRVLDTHLAMDAVNTCLTYSVPATVVPDWLDRASPISKALSEQLAWGALQERRM
jgi:crotonobetainyl-CoA:carnitine CoA-transferase CaiB-like acyl-CoA transferase